MESANRNLTRNMNQSKSKDLHLGLCIGLVCLTEDPSSIVCSLCASQAKFSKLFDFLSHIAQEHGYLAASKVDDAGKIKSDGFDADFLEECKVNRTKDNLQQMDACMFTNKATPTSTSLKITKQELGIEINMNRVKNEKEKINMLEISSKEFYCHYCKTNFSSRNEVVDHICRNIPNTFTDTVGREDQPIDINECNYKCEICNKTFSTLRGFRTHTTRTHRKSVDYKDAPKSTDAPENKSSVHQKNINISDSADCMSLKLTEQKKLFKESVKEHTWDFAKQNESNIPTPTALKVIKFEQHEKQFFSIEEIDAKKFYCGHCDTNFSLEDELLKHICSNNESSSVDLIKTEVGTTISENNNKYCCTICSAKLKTLKILKTHMKAHNPNQTFKCMYCPQTCITASRLKEHLKTHEPSSGETFSCPHCPATRKSQGALTCHLLTHNGQKSFTCDYCNVSYYTAYKLRAHLKKIHSATIGIEFRCNLCSAIFKSRKSLHLHILKHKGERPYKCELCSCAFYRSDLLKIHMVIHSGKKPYKCEQCSKAFYFKDKLKQHMITHSGQKSFSCDQCSSAFYFKDKLKKHMIIHSGNKPYKCDQCSREFKLSAQLKRHIAIHSGERPYKCEQCASAFSLKDALKIHMLIHSGRKPYKCEQCSRGFSQSSYLKRHMITHIVKKSYKCEQCSRGFSHSSYLKKHMITHSGMKSYKCELCTRAFTHSSYLRKHMKTHSENKPFKCEQCPSAFYFKDKLKQHMITHSVKKSYECEQCARRFTHSSYLKKHMKTHSGEKLESEMCSSSFTTTDSLNLHMEKHTNMEIIKVEIE